MNESVRFQGGATFPWRGSRVNASYPLVTVSLSASGVDLAMRSFLRRLFPPAHIPWSAMHDVSVARRSVSWTSPDGHVYRVVTRRQATIRPLIAEIEQRHIPFNRVSATWQRTLSP
jgi:hypothetical protein